MVVLETRRELSRSDVAELLRTFADEIDDGEGAATEADAAPDAEVGGDETDLDRLTLSVGNDSATVVVPPTVEFHLAVDSRSPLLEDGVEQSVEFGLAWTLEDLPDDDDSIRVM